MSEGAGPSGGAGVTYGIDIGGTKVLGVALGASDRIIGEARVPTPSGSRERSSGATWPMRWRSWWPTSTRRWAASVGGRSGVGAPGMVDRHGRLCFAPNLPQAQGVDWTDLVGGRLPGRSVLIENDANFAVLAEHRLGAARRFRPRGPGHPRAPASAAAS